MSTPIVIRAAASGDVDSLRAHIRSHPDSVRTCDAFGRTALHAAASSGEIDAAKVLIEHGAEIDARDDQGRTPLRLAVDAARVNFPRSYPHAGELVDELLSRGADPFATDERGWTPRGCACDHPRTALRFGIGVEAGLSTPERPFRVEGHRQDELNIALEWDRLEACVEYARRHGFPHAMILGPVRSLDFLRELPQLRKLHTGQQDKATDVSALADLVELESLFCVNSPNRFDLGKLVALRKLCWNVRSRTLLPGLDARLEEVAAFHLTPRESDLSFLPAWQHVRELTVGFGRLSTLDGIERFPKLAYVRVVRLPQLTDISALTQLPDLRRLTVEDCPHALDSAALARLSGLRELILSTRSTVPDLEFVRSMTSLQEVRIARLNVTNGDLSPLLDVPEVSLTPFRRHYQPRDFETRPRN